MKEMGRNVSQTNTEVAGQAGARSAARSCCGGWCPAGCGVTYRRDTVLKTVVGSTIKRWWREGMSKKHGKRGGGTGRGVEQDGEGEVEKQTEQMKKREERAACRALKEG